MSAAFDDDLFDAEIVVERWTCDSFDGQTLGLLLGAPSAEAGRQRVYRLMASGKIPAAHEQGNRRVRNRWTRAQVVAIVADRLRQGAKVVVSGP